MQNDNKQQWEQYRARKLAEVDSLLGKLGFELEDEQKHLSGERYLMSGTKLVLVGRRTTDRKRVIIKVSAGGEEDEIRQEHAARSTLRDLQFAYYFFPSPDELLYTTLGGYRISVTGYLEQEKNFLARPLEEQFSLALQAFKTQEGVHATAHSHAQAIKRMFGVWGAEEYLHSFLRFKKDIIDSDPANQALTHTLEAAERILADPPNITIIEQYCGFLTHSDFVPHNLRVIGQNIYLLDQTSLRFGNKYESWARFCNFMLLYNRPLEKGLVQYVEENRTPEESLCMRLMRIYKLTQLLGYYAGTLQKTEGDLHLLSVLRIGFWGTVLDSLVTDTSLPQEIISEYQQKRDTLRSEEEKKRQQHLH